MEEEEIQYVRRLKLSELIKQKFNSLSEFSRQLGTNKGNVSTLLSGARPFSNFTANKIESTFALPTGYLSSNEEQSYVVTDFIGAKFYQDIKYLVSTAAGKNLKIPNEIIKQLNLSNDDNILVTYMNDDLMYPTFKINEMLFIDTGQVELENNKIYLIEVNGLFRIRRLVLDNQDLVLINIDNEMERKNYISPLIPLSDIKIIGRIMGSIKLQN